MLHSWLHIIRLGLVQMCLGAVVVMCTSTLNRLMIVELSLAAIIPGILVAFHYLVQITRPHWGLLSDLRGKRSLWIIIGMVILNLGGFLAACAVLVLDQYFWLGIGLSFFAYGLIGLGVAASGTSLLALLASTTAPSRRAAAATCTWLMMIFGIAVTAGILGQLLDPFEPQRLLMISACLGLLCITVTFVATWGIEKPKKEQHKPTSIDLHHELSLVWSEPKVRYFTIFVFLSMVAYFMQELILEPYAGLVFDYSLGASTTLSGIQNMGVFFGMVVIGISASGFKWGNLRQWTVTGCIGSAAALSLLAAIGQWSTFQEQLPIVVGMLGFFNGIFAVGAIGAMMSLAGEGQIGREGGRMGLWGAAQALAAGFGGLTGAGLSDIYRMMMSDSVAFGLVFLMEATLFLVAGYMALKIIEREKFGSQPMMAGE